MKSVPSLSAIGYRYRMVSEEAPVWNGHLCIDLGQAYELEETGGFSSGTDR